MTRPKHVCIEIDTREIYFFAVKWKGRIGRGNGVGTRSMFPEGVRYDKNKSHSTEKWGEVVSGYCAHTASRIYVEE